MFKSKNVIIRRNCATNEQLQTFVRIANIKTLRVKT